MTTSRDKVVQYLDEARAMELGLVRELQAQIAMTPRGSYRTLLERHLRETRSHSHRLGERLDELDHAGNPVQMIGALAQTVAGQVLAVGRAPLALVRGSGGEEKVLKNAQDSCAAETYVALERLALALDDDRTAKLAASIREDEERMLERLRDELPKLADAVVRADVYGDPSYDLGTIGAVDAVREAAEDDLPISGYDDLTAEQIAAKLAELSQTDVAKVDAYERRGQSRKTILDKVAALRADEPWPGYDELNVTEIQKALRDADETLLAEVRAYERAHKGRASVLRATERKLAAVS
jgi:ferritin-like metal-binding protein YciE